MKINAEECNRDVRTYGDVIRHMTNDELALFLDQMHSNIELGILAIMRAKMYPHRTGGDKRLGDGEWESMYNFMEHRIAEEPENYADVWGVEKWQDLCQWEAQCKKNFGMDIVY